LYLQEIHEGVSKQANGDILLTAGMKFENVDGWSVLRPGPLCLRCPLTVRLGGRTAGMDRFEKKKKIAPDGNKITFTIAHAQHVA